METIQKGAKSKTLNLLEEINLEIKLQQPLLL